ncbi:hypothetical protein [Allomuricauda sp. R78024]|uniref:hypothetical protein n=1 Tax=Allomuricauda sp. R78024 TaxID=3093867 RepID=UPI0037C9E034
MNKTLISAYVAFASFFSFFLCTSQENTTNTGIRSGTQGVNNSYYGFRSGELTTSGTNSFYGAFSGSSNNAGRNNSFFGFSAGRRNIDGINNTFVGNNAGRDNTSGLSNVFLGSGSGRTIQTGNNNVFVGPFSGNESIVGSRNTFVGSSSGRTNTGNANIFIGYNAGFNVQGNNMLYIENTNADIPLIYGDFSNNQVGINTTTIPADMALAVGGNFIGDALFANNRLSIGTTDEDPGYSLTVKGRIHVQEVKVDVLGAIAPDYVFDKDYELKPLEEVEQYITDHGHLPNIPSAEEIEINGLNLKEMNFKLLEKIEELTLYAIDLQHRLKQQEKVNQLYLKRLEKLESKLR